MCGIEIIALKSVRSLRLSDSLGIASERQIMELEQVDGSHLHLILKVCKEGSEAEKYEKVYGAVQQMYEEVLPLLSAFQENV